MVHEQHGGVVLRRIIARHTVGRDHDVEVVEHAIPCGRLDASLGGTTRDDDRLDAVRTQQHRQVGAPKAARSILGHHEFTNLGSKLRKELMPLGAWNGVRQGKVTLSRVPMHPQVEPMLGGRVTHVTLQLRVLEMDHLHTVRSSRLKQPSQPWSHCGIHREIHAELTKETVRVDEIVLHVDHQQRGMGRVHEFVKFGVDHLAIDVDQRSVPQDLWMARRLLSNRRVLHRRSSGGQQALALFEAGKILFGNEGSNRRDLFG